MKMIIGWFLGMTIAVELVWILYCLGIDLGTVGGVIAGVLGAQLGIYAGQDWEDRTELNAHLT